MARNSSTVFFVVGTVSWFFEVSEFSVSQSLKIFAIVFTVFCQSLQSQNPTICCFINLSFHHRPSHASAVFRI